MKLVTLILTILSGLIGMAQNDSQVYIKLKSDPSKSIENVTEIDGDEVNTIALDLSVNPKLLEDIDGFTVFVKRKGCSTEGEWSLTTEEFKSIAKPCSRIEGNLATYPRVMDYAKDAKTGNGHFLLKLHNEPVGAQFVLSRKGMDYSVNEEVDKYELIISAYSYKVIGYEQEWVQSEGRYVNRPVYDPNVKTIVSPITVMVKTNPDIDPMGKSNNVRDVNELKNLFGGN